jgi:hypothetical protein
MAQWNALRANIESGILKLLLLSVHRIVCQLANVGKLAELFGVV